jgi:subtilisin family serine protease
VKRSSAVCAVVLALGAVWPSPALPQEDKRSQRLEWALKQDPGQQRFLVWVFLRDKGAAREIQLGQASALLTPRALARRSRRGRSPLVGTEDAPVDAKYLSEIARRVSRVRHESRWFNAVSVEATRAQIWDLHALPFVARLDLVRRYRRSREETSAELATGGPVRATALAPPAARASSFSFDYGTSLGQLSQIGVPAVHELGLHGEGVVIALFDAGFNNLPHEAFSTMAILTQQDFVNGDLDVADGADQGEGSHGTATLSVIGGFKEGELVGPAFAATYILAKTENTDSETPFEEDNWAAAAEWAESLGADVISSSLGYLEYDGPFTSYTATDMNGETAISTRAADMAAAKGVVVVNSAGNSGYNAEHNTLGAPADGKNVIAAGAVDRLGSRAYFSSVGPTADGRIKPDVAAQGVLVKAASAYSVRGYSTVSGTSFSCPLTAGVAALILQAHPSYTVEQVRSVLRETASQAAAPDNLLGWGIVNALAAIMAPEPATAPVPAAE